MHESVQCVELGAPGEGSGPDSAGRRAMNNSFSLQCMCDPVRPTHVDVRCVVAIIHIRITVT